MNRLGRTASGAAAFLLGLALFSDTAQATFIVEIDEVGSNVVATGSGTIDLTGLTAFDLLPAFPLVEPVLASVILGSPGPSDLYRMNAGPTDFGSGGPTLPNAAIGDAVGITGANEVFGVPHGYVSGSPLSDNMVFDNASFASLGLTPGTYTWSWGPPTAPIDTFVVEIGVVSVVPEPSTLAILGLGLLGLIAVRPRVRIRKGGSG